MDHTVITIECSRCGDTFTDKLSEMYKRSDRHVMRHQEHKIIDERYPNMEPKISRPMGGFDYGKVEWITL